ncbi:hypothetical protein CEXT_252471 [Caerostris extrusa]|uniref:Uncharacterized protein n=1 Tax=Caerostris extrusa TaxID=172846 RepID=A0AAV4MWG9_CAEEX|nr:hypothetical protein CEXT_252471 [Caerostris extrusa]
MSRKENPKQALCRKLSSLSPSSLPMKWDLGELKSNNAGRWNVCSGLNDNYFRTPLSRIKKYGSHVRAVLLAGSGDVLKAAN